MSPKPTSTQVLGGLDSETAVSDSPGGVAGGDARSSAGHRKRNIFCPAPRRSFAASVNVTDERKRRCFGHVGGGDRRMFDWIVGAGGVWLRSDVQCWWRLSENCSYRRISGLMPDPRVGP